MPACLIRRSLLLFALLLLGTVTAAAQNPLGIGVGETPMPSSGSFGRLMAWIADMQRQFYRSLTGALSAMRDGRGGAGILVAISFAYGVFHAAGPGHGKAVISSYMLANETTLRRGIVLSFVSALLQGAVALIVIGAVFLFLRGTSVSMSDASRFLEVSSYALVAGFGAWLLARKLLALWRRRRGGHGHEAGDHDHDHHHHHDEVCAACGHSHTPDPKLLQGTRLDWRSAWTAVAAVGMRPCSGALIVLTFAFLNGLWFGGIASVLAMSLGTAITVAALAVLAVTAKNVATRLAGGGGRMLHDAIEIGGAAMVLVLGLLLLGASLGGIAAS